MRWEMARYVMGNLIGGYTAEIYAPRFQETTTFIAQARTIWAREVIAPASKDHETWLPPKMPFG